MAPRQTYCGIVLVLVGVGALDRQGACRGVTVGDLPQPNSSDKISPAVIDPLLN